MLSINIICVGKVKEKYLQDAINEYTKRLSKYCKLTITELPDEKIPDKLYPNLSDQIKDKECSKILNCIKKDSYLIALNIEENQFSSTEFSRKIEDISMKTSNITFIIGGSLGLNSTLLSNCDLKISFSKMTFPHQLFRVMLLEQLFRAFKIINGETYHK